MFKKMITKWTAAGVALLAAAVLIPTSSKAAVEQQYGYEVDTDKCIATLDVKNGDDITGALDGALRDVGARATSKKRYTVKIPSGNYKLSGITHILSNTTLSAYGATITCDPSAGNFNMLVSGTVSYVNSAKCSGYKGFENINILGGTWVGSSNNKKTQMRIFHASHVTVKDVTIKGGNNNHQLEVAAIDDFKVTGCTFRDMTKASGKREALQLDLAAHNTIYPEIIYDGTMMKNVVISGCKFINVSRGIGSHSLLQGAYIENIQILNNTFTNVDQECVTALNYYKATITGNVMTNCGSGVLFQYSKGDAKTIFTTIQDGKKKYKGTVRTDAASLISGNTIITKYNKLSEGNFGIKLFGRKITKTETNPVDHGKVTPGDYYVAGITVAGNKIKTSGYGISLDDAKKCSLYNNVITGVGYDKNDPIAKAKKYNGIHLGKASVKNVIAGNVINNVQQNGIFLQDKSSASKISNNTIVNPGKNGIHMYGKSKVLKNIEKNTIKNAKQTAISIDNGSIVNGSILSNLIRKSKLNGIYVLNKSRVGKGIKGNKVIGAGWNGIMINNYVKVKGGVSKNKVSKAKQFSIYVLNRAVVSGKIKSNTVDKKKKAIVVAANAKAKLGKNKKK